jgi:hypothetical protein
LSERIGIGKVLPRESFIDYDQWDPTVSLEEKLFPA